MVRFQQAVRLVFLVHDVFPEKKAVAAGNLRRENLLYPLIKRVFDWAYGSADALITIGRDMSEVLPGQFPPAQAGSHSSKTGLTIRCGTDSLGPIMIPFMGLSNRIVIQYPWVAPRAARIRSTRQFA
jgi:hypothetical protein